MAPLKTRSSPRPQSQNAPETTSSPPRLSPPPAPELHHELLRYGTGYLNEYPDHWTQGDDLADLQEHLRDLHQTFSSEEIPGIRKETELEVA